MSLPFKEGQIAKPGSEADALWCLQNFLSVNGIKFYESKMNLNWKPIIKSIQEVRSSATAALYVCCIWHATAVFTHTLGISWHSALTADCAQSVLACTKLSHQQIAQPALLVHAMLDGAPILTLQGMDCFLGSGDSTFLGTKGDASSKDGKESVEGDKT